MVEPQNKRLEQSSAQGRFGSASQLKRSGGRTRAGGNVSGGYVAGAYLLVKPGPPIADCGLTASACLAKLAPDHWAIEWASVEVADRQRHAAELGIRRSELPHVVAWVTGEFDRRFKWPNVFVELEAAREFRERFAPDGVHLIGRGFQQTSSRHFCRTRHRRHSNPGTLSLARWCSRDSQCRARAGGRR